MNKTFYLGDFLKQVIKKHNVSSLIWILLNIVLISFTFGIVFSNGNIPIAFLWGAAFYLITVMAVLSPFGEWVCRIQNGCKKPTDEVLARLQPILDEVLTAARKKNPELPETIRLYISEEEAPNAFALGRRNVCCTQGLLAYPDNEIRAIFGHEIGHIAHKDTDLILVVTGGNLLINILFGFLRLLFHAFVLVANIITFLIPGVGGLIFSLIQTAFTFVSATLLGGFMNAWVKLGIWLTMHSSRKEEFAADAYACRLGYADGLLRFFHRLQAMEGEEVVKKGLFAALEDSHPDISLRIEHIQKFRRRTPVLPSQQVQ